MRTGLRRVGVAGGAGADACRADALRGAGDAGGASDSVGGGRSSARLAAFAADTVRGPPPAPPLAPLPAPRAAATSACAAASVAFAAASSSRSERSTADSAAQSTSFASSSAAPSAARPPSSGSSGDGGEDIAATFAAGLLERLGRKSPDTARAAEQNEAKSAAQITREKNPEVLAKWGARR